MAKKKKTYTSRSLPIAFVRNNPIPLDNSQIWYSLSELESYAKNSSIAYVGQILTYVDETNSTAIAYIIADSQGTLKEVGTGSVSVDGVSIEENSSGSIAIKDFGTKYYKWVATVDDVPGHYEEQLVDSDNPWKAGLELRTVNGTEVGWYEPNTETSEGLNSAVTALQSDVTELRTQLAAMVGAFHFKGELTLEEGQTVAARLAAVSNPAAGDVYQIGEDEWVYVNTTEGWIELGPNIDLSGYATKTALEETNTKVTNNEKDVSDLKTAENKLEQMVSAHTTEIAELKTSADKITQLESDVNTLKTADEQQDTKIKTLEDLVGTPASEEAAATGLHAVISKTLIGVQANGNDFEIKNQKAQIPIFSGSTIGLVPVVSDTIQNNSGELYYLNAAGQWTQPQDSRIGDLGTYSTVVEYIDDKLSWQTIGGTN